MQVFFDFVTCLNRYSLGLASALNPLQGQQRQLAPHSHAVSVGTLPPSLKCSVAELARSSWHTPYPCHATFYLGGGESIGGGCSAIIFEIRNTILYVVVEGC